jgi:hypothetical protein
MIAGLITMAGIMIIAVTTGTVNNILTTGFNKTGISKGATTATEKADFKPNIDC